MTPELEAKIRTEFEKWAKSNALCIDRHISTRSQSLRYDHDRIQCMWEGFLAGRASVLGQLEQVAEIYEHYSGGMGVIDLTPYEMPCLRQGTKLYRLPSELQEEKEKK